MVGRLGGISRSKGKGKGGGPRPVRCYHCRHRFEVGPSAESTNCPHCSQRVIVGDIEVKAILPTRAVQTCGRILVKKGGRVNAELVEAHGGLECHGAISAVRVLSGGAVVIGKHARWTGDCVAPSLEISAGARIEGGRFAVPDLSITLDGAPEAAGQVQAPR